MLEIRKGDSRFSVEVVLSHSAEKLNGGTLLCCVSENFWYRKNLWRRGGRGECHHFRSIFFCLTVPKNFVGQPFRVSLFSGIENFHASEGFVANICRFFCLTVPKNFVEGPFRALLQKFSYSENVYG